MKMCFMKVDKETMMFQFQADSGSPLMCTDSTGARVHVGVVSGGDGLCPSNAAQFYMRTSFYYQWVQDNM